MCGTCAVGYQCTSRQQCAPVGAVPPSIPQLPVVRVSVTTAGDTTAAFWGGVATALTASLGFSFFLRYKRARGLGEGSSGGGEIK